MSEAPEKVKKEKKPPLIYPEEPITITRIGLRYIVDYLKAHPTKKSIKDEISKAYKKSMADNKDAKNAKVSAANAARKVFCAYFYPSLLVKKVYKVPPYDFLGELDKTPTTAEN